MSLKCLECNGALTEDIDPTNFQHNNDYVHNLSSCARVEYRKRLLPCLFLPYIVWALAPTVGGTLVGAAFTLHGREPTGFHCLISLLAIVVCSLHPSEARAKHFEL